MNQEKKKKNKNKWICSWSLKKLHIHKENALMLYNKAHAFSTKILWKLSVSYAKITLEFNQWTMQMKKKALLNCQFRLYKVPSQ